MRSSPRALAPVLALLVYAALVLRRAWISDDAFITLRVLDNAVQGAERGAALTQRLLAFARRQELKPERVDLAAVDVDGDDVVPLGGEGDGKREAHVPQADDSDNHEGRECSAHGPEKAGGAAPRTGRLRQ